MTCTSKEQKEPVNRPLCVVHGFGAKGPGQFTGGRRLSLRKWRGDKSDLCGHH